MTDNRPEKPTSQTSSLEGPRNRHVEINALAALGQKGQSSDKLLTATNADMVYGQYAGGNALAEARQRMQSDQHLGFCSPPLSNALSDSLRRTNQRSKFVSNPLQDGTVEGTFAHAILLGGVYERIPFILSRLPGVEINGELIQLLEPNRSKTPVLFKKALADLREFRDEFEEDFAAGKISATARYRNDQGVFDRWPIEPGELSLRIGKHELDICAFNPRTNADYREEEICLADVKKRARARHFLLFNKSGDTTAPPLEQDQDPNRGQGTDRLEREADSIKGMSDSAISEKEQNNIVFGSVAVNELGVTLTPRQQEIYLACPKAYPQTGKPDPGRSKENIVADLLKQGVICSLSALQTFNEVMKDSIVGRLYPKRSQTVNNSK